MPSAAKCFTVLVALVDMAIVPPARAQDAGRTTIITGDRSASQQAWDRGLAVALPAAMSDSSVLLWPGAPIIVGKRAIARFLTGQPALAGTRWAWQPLHLDIAASRRIALEWGTVTMVGPSRSGATPTHRMGHFLAVWRRNGMGSYDLAVFAPVGVTAGNETVAVDSTGPREWPSLRLHDSTESPALNLRIFAIADSAFAAAAAGNHAAQAFGKWAAADAVTFDGDGLLNIGAARIKASVMAGGDGEWRWAPVFTFSSRGGSRQPAIGYTIGQAVITSRDSAGKMNTFKSKYLTLWKTNPDGTVRFTADGGSGRP